MDSGRICKRMETIPRKFLFSRSQTTHRRGFGKLYNPRRDNASTRLEYRLPSWRYWRIIYQDLERRWIRSKEDAEGSAVRHPLDTTRDMLMISEYSLPGSYRKIIHLPKTFTWSHVSYTDPDISLVQSDEDKILGENPAAEDDPEGMSLLPCFSSFSPTFLLHTLFSPSFILPILLPFFLRLFTS
jgi:hypothetical protein